MTSAWDQVQPPVAVQPPNRIWLQATAPTTPTDGDLWYDQTAQQWKERKAGAWVVVLAGGGGGATLPAATRQGQLLVAGAAPGFDWHAGDADAGRI